MHRLVWLAIGVSAACGSSSPPASGARSRAPAVALPGACVDPAADAAQRLAEVTADLGGVPDDVSGAPDVDGDGTADRLFAAGAGVTTNTLVYVTRGACAHYVGDVQQPPEPAPDADRHHGLIDLRVADSSMCEGARCGCELGELWFRFDGTSYQLDEAASTPSAERPCPDE